MKKDPRTAPIFILEFGSLFDNIKKTKNEKKKMFSSNYSESCESGDFMGFWQ